MNIQEQRAALMNTLTDMLDGLVSSVSIDAQLIRPTAGKVAVFIEPPTVEWPSSVSYTHLTLPTTSRV